MQTETITLDDFFDKYKRILIYKVEYLIGDECCGFREEVVSSKNDVKKYDNLFFRPDAHTFVSGVVIDDDKVFCIIGDTSEEEKLDDSIIENLIADPNKSIYEIHVEFVL